MTAQDNHGKPDIILKRYWQNKERFADLFNAYFFQGKQVINPEDLEEEPTEVSNVVEGSGAVISMPRLRDVAMKHRKSDVVLVVLGMENETKIHYAMPLREYLYDGLSYQKQCDALAAWHKEKKDLNQKEFLSHMKNEDKLKAVISVVVYYGEEPWDGAMSLYEMLDIPKEWESFVNDYQMNLIEVRKSGLVFHNKDNRDLFELFDILYNTEETVREKREKAIQYDTEHQADLDVLRAVAVTSDCKTLLENRGQEAVDMCSVFEAVKEEGRAEGKAEEIVLLYQELGKSEDDIVAKLQERLNITMEKAKLFYGMFRADSVK